MLTVLLVMGAVRSLSPPSCPTSYQDKGLSASSPTRRICIYHTDAKFAYCAAQAHCREIGGELLTGSEGVEALTHYTDVHILVGLTDLLEERGKGRSGWRWTNGEVADASIFGRKCYVDEAGMVRLVVLLVIVKY